MTRSRRCWVLLACLIVAFGCGDDDGGASPDSGPATDMATPDSGTDDGATDAGPPMDAGPYLCGPEPRVHVRGRITSYTNMMMGLAGVRGTLDLCPELSIVTDENGDLEGEVARGMAYNPRLEARGYITMRTGQQILEDDFDLGGFLFPTLLSSLLPHFGEDRPTILAITFGGRAAPAGDGGVVDAGAPAPCDTPEGSVFAVEGHPEAVVTYFSGTTTPVADESLTATGPLGAAEISGLEATAPGELVTLTATKPGCAAITFASYPHTGRYVLENGVLTVAAAFLDPVSPP